MPLWAHTFGDLMSIGVSLSPEQRACTQHGGQVLIAKYLPNPDFIIDGYGTPDVMKDLEGDPVMVPAIFEAYPPDQTWEESGRSSSLTAAEEMEACYGKQWRRWPSYAGVINADIVACRTDVQHRLRLTRAWTGIPLLYATDRVLARYIVACFRKMIAESCYEEYLDFFDSEANLLELGSTIYLNDPSDEWTDEYFGLRHHLVDHGLLAENPDGSYTTCRQVFIPPLEQFLTDPLALAMWNRVSGEVAVATSRVRNSMGSRGGRPVQYLKEEHRLWED